MRHLIHASALALILGGAVALASPAYAADEACPGNIQVDGNGDGLIGMEEYTAYGDSLFDDWDDDEDGRLSREEFGDCLGDRAETLFAEWDKDEDGWIDEDEFLDEEQFAVWDADDDDALSDDEFLFDDFLI